MNDVKTYSKKMTELRQRKYVVRPIRRRGGWVPSDHDSSFLNDGTSIGIVVPVREGNVLIDPFKVMDKPNSKEKEWTEKDKLAFVQEIGLSDIQSLNVHVQKNFWRGNTVFLDRNGLHLNLENPEHLVKFLILRSDTTRIAPNWVSRFNKGTYKFALCEEGEELREEVSNLEDKKNAYLYFSEIDHSIVKMTDFLYVYYLSAKGAKRPPRTANADWLKKELGRIIDDDLSTFIAILGDDNYKVKLLIQRSVEVGALLLDKHYYRLPGSDHPIGVLQDLINFLGDTKNQEVYMKLSAHIQNKTKE